MLAKHYLFTLIKRQKMLFLAMALMSALTFGMFVGSGFAFDNYKISMDEYFNNYNYPSAFITTEATTKDSFKKLKNVDGVNDYDVRFSSLFNIKVKDESLEVVLSTYKKNDFSKFAYMSDCIESDNIGIYVDQQFAETHNIKEGDTIKVGKRGHFCKCTVSRIVLKPENFCVYALGDIPTDNIGYGAIFMNHKDLDEFLSDVKITNFGLDSNQVLLDIDSSYDKQKVLDKCCDKISKNVEVTSHLIDEDTPPVKLRNEFDAQFGVISEAVPLAHLIIMSIIFVLFLIQIIKKQAREIGIFLAAGFQKKSVYFLFASFTFLISIFSIVLGILISIPMSNINYSIYQSGIYLPNWTRHAFYKDMVLSCIIIIIAGQFACLLSSLTFKESSPMDALDKNHQHYINIGRKFELFIYRVPNAIRLALNSILQNSRNFVVIVLGFIASFVLIFSSLSVYYSMQEYVNYTYDVQNDYDVQVVSLLGDSKDNFDELKDNKNVTKMQLYDTCSTNIKFDGKKKSANIIGFPINCDMLKFQDANTGERIRIPKKGIVLDKILAEKLGVEPGDSVKVGKKKLEVKAITAIYTRPSQVVSTEQMKELKVDKLKCALVNIKDQEKFEKFCAASDNELCPIFSSNFKQMEMNFKGPFTTIISIIVVIAVILGFVVVCTVSKMTLDKQKRVISILRSQGMSLTAISNYWSIQMLVQLVVAFLLGKPLATVSARFFVGNLCSDTSYFPFIQDFNIYLLAFSFIVAFSIATHFVIVFLTSRFNLAQNVQSRE